MLYFKGRSCFSSKYTLHVDWNMRHLKCFVLFQVHKGVHGFVQDKSGKAISKAVIVLNEGLRVCTKEGGYFHVLLAPGLHNINAIADGYQQKHMQVCEYLLELSSLAFI